MVAVVCNVAICFGTAGPGHTPFEKKLRQLAEVFVFAQGDFLHSSPYIVANSGSHRRFRLMRP
jgi:hypothetical protein